MAALAHAQQRSSRLVTTTRPSVAEAERAGKLALPLGVACSATERYVLISPPSPCPGFAGGPGSSRGAVEIVGKRGTSSTATPVGQHDPTIFPTHAQTLDIAPKLPVIP